MTETSPKPLIRNDKVVERIRRELTTLNGRFKPLIEHNEILKKDIDMMKGEKETVAMRVVEMEERNEILESIIKREMDNNDSLRDLLEYEKGKSEKLSERVATAHHLKNIAIREAEEKKIENELIKVEIDKVKATLEKAQADSKELKNNEKILKEQKRSVILKMKKEERKTNRYKTRLSRVIPPYDGLASRKGQYNRIEKAFSYLQYLAGTNSKHFYKDIVLKMERKGVLKLKLTDKEGFRLYHCTRMTRHRLKLMKREFKANGVIDPLPNIQAIVSIEGDVGSKEIFTVKQEKSVKEDREVVVVHLTDVVKSLTHRVQELIDNQKLTCDFSRALWVTILGDKGDAEFKLCLSIANVENSNSCYHLLPVGIFDDDESSVAIQHHMGVVVEQLNRLKSLKINIGGTQYDLPVEFFVGGDMKMQYDVLGHQGGASTYSCMFCKKKAKQLIKNYKRGEDVELRTEETYVEDSLKGTPKKPVHSIKAGSEPLFKSVKISNFIPGSLHIISGLAQRMGFDYLLTWSAQMDCKKKIHRKDIKKKRISSDKIQMLETELKTLDLHIQSMSRIVEVLHNIKNRRIDGSDELEANACQAEKCLFRDKAMELAPIYDSHTLHCSICDCRLHALCSGCWSIEHFFQSFDSLVPFECFACRGLSGDRIDARATAMLDELKMEKLNMEKELIDEKSAFDTNLSAIKGNEPTRKLLESIWKRHGAYMSTWQQNFVGNHIHKLLQEEAVDEYMSIFKDHEGMPSMSRFLKALGELQRICLPKMLSDEEIDRMENIIDTIWVNLQDFAAEDKVIPKLHVLLEHVMPFVRLHRTWAKTSEQPIESIHAYYNSTKVQFRTIRNKKLKATMCFKSLLYKNFISDHS